LGHSFLLPAERMLVDAKLMGDDRDYCYVPVFDHGLSDTADSQVIVVGNLFMERYYFVYDMSPLEYNEDYIQIAFGIKN
jgi:hypothetical protein